MNIENENYLHGFTTEEQDRLYRQARFLEHKIFSDINYSDCRHILEVGTGVGAQCEILLRRFPEVKVTGIDYSEDQIKTAHNYLSTIPGISGRYNIQQMNAMDMGFNSGEQFDGAYLCWVLEHMPDPVKTLSEVRRVLKKGSKIYVSEVLNSTFFLEPYSPAVLEYWMKFNDLQYEMGGDPFIGAKLGNLLHRLGYSDIQTQVKTFHLDNRNPSERASMIAYWQDLLLSGLPVMKEKNLITDQDAEQVKRELNLVAKSPDAVFFYSFIQAFARTT